MTEIFTLLSALGDIASMALVAVLWSFDRRILRIETRLEEKNA